MVKLLVGQWLNRVLSRYTIAFQVHQTFQETVNDFLN